MKGVIEEKKNKTIGFVAHILIQTHGRQRQGDL